MKYVEAEIKENYIYCSLLQIKKNPYFVLGGKSIRALDGFLMGIGFALPQSKRQYFSWYKEFQDYVLETCQAKGKCFSLSEAVLSQNHTDETGFDYFFQLLDIFVQENVMESDREADTKVKPQVIHIEEKDFPGIVEKYLLEHAEEIFHLPQPSLLTGNSWALNLEWEEDKKGCWYKIFELTDMDKVIQGKNIYELLPQDKFDNRNIEKLKMLEDKEIKLLIPELLEWLQDYNWPVAEEVLQVLLQRENLVVPCVKEILEGPVDVCWFIWLMDLLIPTFTKEHKEEFREILYRIKNMKITDEDTKDLAEEAEKCWEKCFD